MKKSVEERVKGCVVDQYGVAPSQIKDTDNLEHDLGGDSLDHVELIMALEEEFSFEIPDEGAEKLITVGDFIEYVKKNAVFNEKEE